MSTFWKSLPRYNCKYCNYWCVDNRINRENHDSSEKHKLNVERFLERQETTKDRQASKDREVARIIKQAEEEARDMMNMNLDGTIRKGGLNDLSNRRATSKKNEYLMNDRQPIFIPYDTVNSNGPYPTGTMLYGQGMMNFPTMSSSPAVYDPMNSSIPPPPPMSSNTNHIIYDPSSNIIPPPPPLSELALTIEEEEKEDEEKEISTVQYNFNNETNLTEEDLFGGWKTVSVMTLTDESVKERDAQYLNAVMKSSKGDKKKGDKTKEKSDVKEESEDEDEKDAFDLYNPFGGGYKGVDISSSEPMYIPEKKQSYKKQETERKEEESTLQPSAESKQFISTPISFSFKPQISVTIPATKAPTSKSLLTFFS